MQRRGVARVLVGALLVTSLAGCRAPRPRQQPLPFLATADGLRDTSRQAGVFYTVYVLHLAPEEHGLMAELWQYVDEAAAQGAHPELRRINNLRVGVLKERFRQTAAAILERMHTETVSAVPTFCPLEKTYYYDCGRPPGPAVLFYWSEDDLVDLWTYSTVSLWMAVASAPAGKDVAEFIVTPALGLEGARRASIRSLATTVRCPVGCSVIIGARDPQEGSGPLSLGAFFRTGSETSEEREQVIILTADAVTAGDRR